MFVVPPAIHNFPLVRTRSSVDIFAVLQFEPIHLLSITLNKMLKECILKLSQIPKEPLVQLRKDKENQMPVLGIEKRF